MNWRLLFVFSLIISLSGAKIALGNDQHGSNMDMKGQQSIAVMKNGGSMAGMDMKSDMMGMDMKDDMQGMDMGHKPVKETPPNLKVLGTFGSLNFLFIAMGIWAKFLRRKDVSDGNSK